MIPSRKKDLGLNEIIDEVEIQHDSISGEHFNSDGKHPASWVSLKGQACHTKSNGSFNEKNNNKTPNTNTNSVIVY